MYFGSLFRDENSTLLVWAGSAEIGGPLSLLDSSECVWLEWLFPDFLTEFVSHMNISTTRHNTVWEWVPQCLLI